jgi:hypothetical protein
MPSSSVYRRQVLAIGKIANPHCLGGVNERVAELHQGIGGTRDSVAAGSNAAALSLGSQRRWRMRSTIDMGCSCTDKVPEEA